MNAPLSNRKASGACFRDSAINSDNDTRVPYQQAEWRAYHLDSLTLDYAVLVGRETLETHSQTRAELSSGSYTNRA
jgi:hypothetical protein